ncbi:YtxH domain-containing protein [Alkalihalobacillus pseudalcaliphilus]|uniref:YtxH domain-containing protein n=1 Tax=Alkalihalobacillus pseudalcaliphilus TaxID=79884 RepID=UPI00064D9891|nr:YtxH domain-containing protein [Alkalihalobacillus pseudalcaliphilus]KMK75686.1 hypothetical protein AB990_10400 [Alkalihalobacillus pseudalcaliphilus]
MKAKSYLFGLITGVSVGALCSLLTAPYSGKVLRSKLHDQLVNTNGLSTTSSNHQDTSCPLISDTSHKLIHAAENWKNQILSGEILNQTIENKRKENFDKQQG